MNRRSTVLFVVSILALDVACSSSPPPKAPGTNPGDMSAEEHEKKAAQHEQMSAEHEEEANSVGTTGRTPLSEEALRKQHEDAATREKDVAQQHHDAADKASKP
ncbi:MAG: hypothetical protein QM784_04080 [Polyangiaceae bacterium]